MDNWKAKIVVMLSSSVVSIFTSSIMQMALIWHLALMTESALVLSLATMAGFLPRILLSSFAGALVDRWNRKITIIVADLYLAVVALGLVVYAQFAQPPVWVVLLALFLRSAGKAFHNPAWNAVLPLIVPKEHMTKFIGYAGSIDTITFIAGASVAAILYPLWGIQGMIAMEVAGAVLASIVIAVISIPSIAPVVRDKGQTLTTDLKSAFAILKQHKGMFVLFWITAIFTFFYMPVSSLYPLMSMGHFGGTTTHASIAEIVFAVGATIGGMLIGVWGGLKKRGVMISAALGIMGLSIVVSGLLPADGFVFFAGLSFLVGMSVSFYVTPDMALVQEKIPPEYLGRIFGLRSSISAMMTMLGLFVSGISADIIGIPVWFVISGGVIFFIAIITILMPTVRNIEEE